MNFSENKLPSSMKELEWHWKQCVQERFNFNEINIHGRQTNFNLPADYFNMTDNAADKFAFIGRHFGLYSQPVSMMDFELNIFGEINPETQIGGLLSSIKHLRSTADVYGFFARYKYVDKSVYCAITVCYVDKDFGTEMETAVIEIGEDKNAYILPIAISEEALDYFSFDDIAKLAYWLGNFWTGIQYELNNCPEEIRVIEQRGSITTDLENEIRNEKRVILVKRVIPIDENGNEIKYGAAKSGRRYAVPSWGVRGHNRTLQNGRIIPVKPYRKGKDRNNPKALESKEYQFVEGNVNLDVE